MSYRIVSRFYDRAADRYVDPGCPCPALDAETAARLVAAGCIVEDGAAASDDTPAAAAIAPAKPARAPRGVRRAAPPLEA